MCFLLERVLQFDQLHPGNELYRSQINKTIQFLKEMFEQCIDNYLDLCEKIGERPDKEFKGTFNVRIPPEMHKKAALAAAKQKITLNQYVMKAINESFEA